MATYRLFIDGVEKDIQPGWNHSATANGQDSFTFNVLSADGSYRPVIDKTVYFYECISIVSSSVANPTIITTLEDHGFVTGQTVYILGHTGGTPGLSGAYTVTRISATTFSLAVNVTVAGSSGTASRRLHGGYVSKPAESGLGGKGVVPITTKVDSSDFNELTDRRYVNEVLLSGTLKSQLTTLVTNYLPECTIHPDQVDGPTIGDQPLSWVLLRNALDTLSTLSAGYLWEIDPYLRARMFIPGSEVAPLNIIDGNGVAEGDITVEPTRESYTNYVILRFSASATSAYGFMSMSANFADGENVVLGGTTYTFKSPFVDAANNIAIGASIDDSLNNLIAAVTFGAGEGSAFGTGTTINSSASLYLFSTDIIKAIALTPGEAGNSIAATSSSPNALWYGEGSIPIITLEFGSDQALTNVSIAKDDSEITAHGRWDSLVEAADVTNDAEAATLAAAYLAVHLPVPKTVHYGTYKLGLRPGQTQTITISSRNVNNTFLITDVVSNTVGNLVYRSVTAIESLYIQSADRWQDFWKKVSSGSGGNSAASISGGGGSITVTGAIYSFGGSDSIWVKTTSGAWISANSIQVKIDTTSRGSTVGTVYARIRAISGSVTARLRNVTDGITVGTSSTITNTSFETVSFSVDLTPGVKYYEIQLSPSVSNADIQLGSGFME